MDLQHIVSVGISLVALLGGFLSYVFNLRIKHDLLVNNEKYEKELVAIKDIIRLEIIKSHDEIVRELGIAINKNADKYEKVSDKLEKAEKAFSESQALLSERIITVVNGKYVRTDVFQQTLVGIQDRFVSIKELIEVNLEKIEQVLDHQIADLKDRIFHTRKDQ